MILIQGKNYRPIGDRSRCFFNFFMNFRQKKFQTLKKLKNIETDLRSVYNFFPVLGSYLTLYFNSLNFDFWPLGGELRVTKNWAFELFGHPKYAPWWRKIKIFRIEILS